MPNAVSAGHFQAMVAIITRHNQKSSTKISIIRSLQKIFETVFKKSKKHLVTEGEISDGVSRYTKFIPCRPPVINGLSAGG